jgi:hypothetical protein
MKTLIMLLMILQSALSFAADNQALPYPLQTLDGRTITSAEGWQNVRRPEILELFRSQVYGRASVGRPDDLKFVITEIKKDVMDGKATRKQIDITFAGPGGEGVLHLMVFIPNNASKPVPVTLLINHRSPADPNRERKSTFWPVEEIIARGYAAATFHASDVDPDKHDGFKNGVHGIFDAAEENRPTDLWGTIAAWAWGASRAMDYFESDSDINSNQVMVVGHSRGGKAALWAGAIDNRFAMTVSNDSGCTGAALAKRKKGETVKDINDRFPHWFNDNYKQYNDNENALPIDQHLLIALMAPRLVYVASASEDDWADPEGEFLATVNAGPVYNLFGLEGVGTSVMPEPDQPVHIGRIGYHLRTGGHNLTVYDWKCYMDFAEKQWGE